MAGHTTNWGMTLLEYYRLTNDPKYLVIARAAANTLTQYQMNDGRIPTMLVDQTFGNAPHDHGQPTTMSFWPAGTAASARLWVELATIE